MPFWSADYKKLTMRQTILTTYIKFYFSLDELDEVKKPSRETIENDKRMDEWYEQFREKLKMKLIDYYSKTGEDMEVSVMPKTFSRTFGAEDAKKTIPNKSKS